MKKIERKFGQEIGGSRYDMWHAGDVLRAEDLDQMTDGQKERLVIKNNVWPKPDYEGLIRLGNDADFLYYMKKVRDSLPAKASKGSPEEYVQFVEAVKNKLESGISEPVKDVADWLKREGFIVDQPIGYGYKKYVALNRYCTNKTFQVLKTPFSAVRQERYKKEVWFTEDEKKEKWYKLASLSDFSWRIDKERKALIHMVQNGCYWYYGDLPLDGSYDWHLVVDTRSHKVLYYNEDEAACKEKIDMLFAVENALKKGVKEAGKPGKKAYVPPILAHIERTGGMDYRFGKEIQGKDFLDVFQIKGGEFGEWLSDKERQANMNFAYDSFLDLANALSIADTDIAFNGALSIAFGARGHGNALAHFEPCPEVINLTKMRGAGSLAHEWIHGLDWEIGNMISPGKYATDLSRRERNAAGFTVLSELLDSFAGTEFRREAIKLDMTYRKMGHGYWQSQIELLARAGAAYVYDKLKDKGIRNDYLCGHANYNAPKGEERKMFDEKFDALVLLLKEKGFFHERTEIPKFFVKEEEKERPWEQMSIFDFNVARV